MLAVGIVHEHHREFELLRLVHGLKPENTGRGLFASAYDIGNQLSIFGMYHVYEVTAVVNDDVRAYFNDFPYPAEILFFGSAVDSEYVQPLMYERCRNVILCGKRVASCDIHLGAALCQYLTQMRCLRFQMYG